MERIPNNIHAFADVKNAKIGENTLVWQYTVVLDGAIIGRNTNINSHCFIENDVIIGNNVTIKSGVYLWDGIIIQDDVFVGPNVTFTNDKYPRSKRKFNIKKTCLNQGCSIGAGAIILCGLTIGEFAMIGAGSLLTKDVPPYQLWYGTPAIHKGYVTKEGQILDLNLTTKEGIPYHFVENQLLPL